MPREYDRESRPKGSFGETPKLEQNKNIFQENWMNECYKNLSYPNERCIGALEKLSTYLARHVTRAQDSEQKQQALFLLLGKDFTEHYFPRQKYNVAILDPPKMTERQRDKYIADMTDFLKKCLSKAIKDAGYPPNMSERMDTNDEIGRYVFEIRQTFREALLRKMKEKDVERQKLVSGKGAMTWTPKQRSSSAKDNRLGDDEDPFAHGSDDIMADDAGDYGVLEDNFDNDLEDDDDTMDAIATAAPFSSYETNVAAQTVVNTLLVNSERKLEFKQRLQDQLPYLPLPLRQYFWNDYWNQKEVLRHSATGPGTPNSETSVAVFKKQLSQSMKQNDIPVATKSKSSKTIGNHVVEIIDGSSALKDIDTMEMNIRITNCLNVLHNHSQKYSPSFALFVIPLVFAFPYSSGEEGDQLLQLASRLDMFVKHCKLSSPDIFKLADEVWKEVQKQDALYAAHIKSCLNNQINKAILKDFLPEYFIPDARSAQKIYSQVMKSGDTGLKEQYEKEITDPRLFLRKWIGQLFVGVLSLNGMMFAWDQLFLEDWSQMTVKHIAVTILCLIKPWMMRATMYSGARKVFLEEPGKLYTTDIRKGLDHIRRGGRLSTMSRNKNFVESDSENYTSSLARLPLNSPVAKPPNTSSGRPPVSVNPLDSADDQQPSKNGTELSTPFWFKPIVPIADLSTTLNFGDIEEPVIEPRPDDDSDEEDPPPTAPYDDGDPAPPESPPPPPPSISNAWLPRTEAPIPNPKPISNMETLDLYVDYVRFIPDNIVVCKVGGRIMNTGQSKENQEFSAYPLLSGSQRCPAFRFKLVLNKSRQLMNANSIIMFRVYGYQRSSENIVVIGTCLLEMYTNDARKPKLRVGGHQMRLRHGLPVVSGGVENMDESDMENNAPIPGVSLCIRLMPAQEYYDPTPRYEEAFYESSSCEPTASESRLFEHYISMEDYETETVAEEIQLLRKMRKEKPLQSDGDLQTYVEALLDHKKQLTETRVPVPDLDYQKFVWYDQERGVNICIQGAFGLPVEAGKLFTHAFGEVYLGKKSKKQYGPEFLQSLHLVTERVDMKSMLRSPDWLDLKTTLKVPLDGNSHLVVRIFGILPQYEPMVLGDTGEGEYRKDMRSKVGISYSRPLGWAVVPLFGKDFVDGGHHLLALFQGELSSELLSALEFESSVPALLKKFVDNKKITLVPDGFVEVEIWDGHLESEDIPEPSVDVQLTTLGNYEKAMKSREANYGKTFSDLLLDQVPRSQRDKATGETLKMEMYFYQEEVQKQFKQSLNEALVRAEKLPLVLRGQEDLEVIP